MAEIINIDDDDDDDDECGFIDPPAAAAAAAAARLKGPSSSGAARSNGAGSSSNQPLVIDESPNRVSGGARSSGGGSSNQPLLLDSDDDDDECVITGANETNGVEEVAAPEKQIKKARVQADAAGSDDDLEIVGEFGDSAADFPHARCDCSSHKFFAKDGRAKLTTAGNADHCGNCYCFVCDCPVAECKQWTSDDAKKPAHCNAHGKPKLWKDLRKAKQQAAARANKKAKTG